LSIASEPYRAPVFQQVLDYLCGMYGNEDGKRLYYEWLNYHGFNETKLLMHQKQKSLTKTKSLIDLFKKSRTRKHAEETVKKKIIDETPEEQKSSIIAQLRSNETLLEAIIHTPRSQLRHLAKVCEGKPETRQHPEAVNVLELAMHADLKKDPLILRKIGKFIEGEE
jgi:hypothetical protein